jgi:hypothetical protein
MGYDEIDRELHGTKPPKPMTCLRCGAVTDPIIAHVCQGAPHCHDTPRPLRSRVWAGVELGGIVLAGISVFMLAAGTCGLTVGVFVRAYSFAAGEP